ncbi:MAG: diaminobutyrate acetyltransferase [Rhodospirillales bacterium]|nr:diaminobutyrate acetyltransferase [Rhodospirillales bacterium]
MTISERLDRNDRDLILRRPTPEDGVAVNDLVEQCKPLDENSVYCNLLQCSHFSETCSLAELDGEPVGFVSGYIVPEEDNSLFVWQVAVSPKARGLKLAKRMIIDILRRPASRDVRHIKTTITPDNKASHGVFKSVARELGADIEQDVLFDKEEHFDGQQKSEVLWNIGPFKRADLMPALMSAA